MAVMDRQGLAPAAWARQNFAAADLGDQRRTDRLVESAQRAARRPGGSLPHMMQDPAALDARTKEVIGLADQRLFVRPRLKNAETRAQTRARKNRQSRLWVASSDAVGTAPAGGHWVEVCDREADTFEYLGRCFATGRSFV